MTERRKVIDIYLFFSMWCFKLYDLWQCLFSNQELRLVSDCGDMWQTCAKVFTPYTCCTATSTQYAAKLAAFNVRGSYQMHTCHSNIWQHSWHQKCSITTFSYTNKSTFGIQLIFHWETIPQKSILFPRLAPMTPGSSMVIQALSKLMTHHTTWSDFAGNANNISIYNLLRHNLDFTRVVDCYW